MHHDLIVHSKARLHGGIFHGIYHRTKVVRRMFLTKSVRFYVSVIYTKKVHEAVNIFSIDKTKAIITFSPNLKPNFFQSIPVRRQKQLITFLNVSFILHHTT
jgi:hypothetical protein